MTFRACQLGAFFPFHVSISSASLPRRSLDGGTHSESFSFRSVLLFFLELTVTYAGCLRLLSWYV